MLHSVAQRGDLHSIPVGRFHAGVGRTRTAGRFWLEDRRMRREPDPSENNSTGSAQTIALVFAITTLKMPGPLVLSDAVLVLETTVGVARIVDPEPARQCVATRKFPLDRLLGLASEDPAWNCFAIPSD